ncbi:uncharacterized protein LOC9629655 [Selaginella moellendorffii]|nr:uncharacterized protein LOC9629655 [Selaginella moellendorffii]|eukprot:XP_002961857.2 uncharacterized protein LOC9629655 [Selaginella moellendorffii]
MGDCCACYGSLVSSSKWRIGFVVAASGKKSVEVSRPLTSRKAAGKLKLHRTWTPGRRVSKERYLSDRSMTTDQRSEGREEDGNQNEEAPSSDGVQLGLEFPQEEEEVKTSSKLNCQHFSRCSGCAFENGLNNPPVYNEAVTFFQKRRIAKLQLIPSATHGWRCRAKLAVRGTSDDPFVGLFEEHSHSIVDIPECRAHHPSINAAVELIKAVIRDVGVQPYDDETCTGQLRYIQLVVNSYVTSVPVEQRKNTCKVQVSLVWNSRDEDSPGTELLHKMAYSLWRRGGQGSRRDLLHSIWANFQTTQTNIILGQRWRRLFGHSELWERVGGADVCYAPSSFGQANYQSFEDLLQRLQRYVRKGSAVVDMFAGVGVIGLSLAATRKCRFVKCVEVNKHCKEPFERSLSRLPASVDCQISWHCADAAEAPITWLEGADVVVVDPPRKGLQPVLIEALRTASLRAQGKTRSPSRNEIYKVEKRPWMLRAKDGGVQREGETTWRDDDVWPEQLIYVSCGWDSFKQDCEALEENGHWHLANAHAYNFFPGTDSIEILAVFRAGKRMKKKTRA